MEQWPAELDLSKFHNNMISGLSLSEIIEINGNGNDICEPDKFIEENIDGILGIPSGSSMQFYVESDQRPSTSNESKQINPTINSRFALPVTIEQITKKKSSMIPKGTRKRDIWAMNVFDSWRENRKHHILEEEEGKRNALEKDTAELTTEELKYWIPKFIAEIRKQDGSLYPGDSLVSIVSGLQRR